MKGTRVPAGAVGSQGRHLCTACLWSRSTTAWLPEVVAVPPQVTLNHITLPLFSSEHPAVSEISFLLRFLGLLSIPPPSQAKLCERRDSVWIIRISSAPRWNLDKYLVHSWCLIKVCILAWGIPWTEEPGGLQPIGLQWVGHDWSDSASTPKCMNSRVQPDNRAWGVRHRPFPEQN